MFVGDDHQREAASPSLVGDLGDQRRADAPPPRIRFDEQAIELEMTVRLQDCGEAKHATGCLGHINLPPSNLLGRPVDCIGMGLEVRPIILVSQRGPPLQRFKRVTLVGPRETYGRRVNAL